MALRTSNPALSEKAFENHDVIMGGDLTMTIDGTVNRCFFLLIVLLIPAIYVWQRFFKAVEAGNMEMAVQGMMPFLIGGVILGFIFAMITIFKPSWAPVTAIIYAACEGFFLGGLSAVMEAQYSGVVIQAVALTFAVLFGMLILYRARIIRATEKFRSGLLAAMGGIIIVYIATILLGFFGVNIPYIHGSGAIGIGFSLFVVTIAALNLVLDFDLIEKGAGRGAPKYFEWYAAFGLLVTLVWLYLEILRLLSKLNRR